MAVAELIKVGDYYSEDGATFKIVGVQCHEESGKVFRVTYTTSDSDTESVEAGWIPMYSHVKDWVSATPDEIAAYEAMRKPYL